MIKKKAVPMFHVPDVLATVEWYQTIGFAVDDTYGNEGDGLSFAVLSFGDSQVMFSQDGSTSTSRRREVDLYVYTEGIDQLYDQFKERVDVIEEPHDTFYGMREFLFRDLNRFWITFAQVSVFTRLMQNVQENNVEGVRKIVVQEKLKPETLTSAMAACTSPEIEDVLKSAGAIPPAKVDPGKLESYAGRYSRDNLEVKVTFENQSLFAASGRQQPLRLLALTETTFTPMYLDDFGKFTFTTEDGKGIGCTLYEGSHAIHLQRIATE